MQFINLETATITHIFAFLAKVNAAPHPYHNSQSPVQPDAGNFYLHMCVLLIYYDY
jgi:hypothetical protein